MCMCETVFIYSFREVIQLVIHSYSGPTTSTTTTTATTNTYYYCIIFGLSPLYVAEVTLFKTLILLNSDAYTRLPEDRRQPLTSCRPPPPPHTPGSSLIHPPAGCRWMIVAGFWWVCGCVRGEVHYYRDCCFAHRQASTVY